MMLDFAAIDFSKPLYADGADGQDKGFTDDQPRGGQHLARPLQKVIICCQASPTSVK
jgi:hypothetical protein